MELSKLQRELISRGTAAAFGAFLIYLAVGCFRWGEAMRTDPTMGDLRKTVSHSGRGAAAHPVLIPYTLMTALGMAGGAVVLFAIVPTQLIYAINPRHWEPSE